MATRGFLIRFIDIGLIVLFGFLMISDIDATTRVELADAGEEPEVVPEEDTEARGVIAVEIQPDGRFVVREFVTGVVAAGPGGDSSPDASDTPADEASGEGDARFVAAEISELEAIVATLESAHAARELSTVVSIQPHPASVVQATVDVMDMCDRLGITKSLSMDIEVAGPAAGEGGEG